MYFFISTGIIVIRNERMGIDIVCVCVCLCTWGVLIYVIVRM